MKTIIIIFYMMFLCIDSYAFNGIITENSTWKGKVYLDGDVVVSKGTLTIMPGTEIIVNSNSSDNILIKRDSYDTDSSIIIAAKGDGKILASGSRNMPIIFTSKNQTSGDWGRIQLIENNDNSKFEHCVIEYAETGLCAKNEPGAPNTGSVVDMNHCEIRYTSKSAIYADTNCSVNVSNSIIQSCIHGIFLIHNEPSLVKNTVINKVSCGIIIISKYRAGKKVTLVNNVIANVTASITEVPFWWTGYGIFCDNNLQAGLLLKNSIIYNCEICGLVGQRDAMELAYNCWYKNRDNVEYGIVGRNDIEKDPQFLDVKNNNFMVSKNSPCFKSGENSINIGLLN